MRWERVGFAFAGGCLILLLTVACNLSPAPLGYGTHQQLGFPGCSMMTVFGMRCPGCGMTTSWSHFVRGEFAEAWSSNAGGTLLCGLSIVIGPAFMVWGISGRSPGVSRISVAVLASLCIALGVAMVEWMIRLAFDR